MVESIDHFIMALGMAGLLVLGLAAMLEYLVPPFPGDTITLLGGVYAVRGEHPWPLVFLIITAGSVAGAAINYWFGTWLARRFEAHPQSASSASPTPGWRRCRPGCAGAGRGCCWPTVSCRASGASSSSPRGPRASAPQRAAARGAVGHGLQCTGVDHWPAVGGNLERLESLVAKYQLAVVVLVVIGVLAVVVRALARRTPPPERSEQRARLPLQALARSWLSPAHAPHPALAPVPRGARDRGRLPVRRAGCSGGARGDFRPRETEVDFGRVLEGEQSRRTVTLLGTGRAGLTVSASSQSPFAVTEGSVFVPGGGTATVEVVFTAGSEPVEGTLVLTAGQPHRERDAPGRGREAPGVHSHGAVPRVPLRAGAGRVRGHPGAGWDGLHPLQPVRGEGPLPGGRLRRLAAPV